jgi:hypothetical protein
MTSKLKTIFACLVSLLFVVGCGTPQPVPFQLVDAASIVQKGTLFPDGQRVEAVIDGQLYKGFYIVAGQVAFSETLGGRLSPRDTVTTTTSNSVRAQISSEKGQQLSCEFLLESKRAIGECKSPAGKVFQLTADGMSH